MDIAVLRNENERLKEQLAQTQAALAESEEARQRLETIVVNMRREKFGAKSEKLRPDQFHLPLEDVEIAQGVLRRRRRRSSRANPTVPPVRPIAIAVSCRLICQGWNGLSSRRARCAHAAAARWQRS